MLQDRQRATNNYWTDMIRLNNKILVVIAVSILLIFSFIFVEYLKNLERPNIILITIDALRPDHMSCYGYKKNTTPYIDTIAKQGVMFKQALTVAPWTYPVMFSLFSSFYPSVYGMTPSLRQLNNIVLFGQALKHKGYYKTAVCGHHALSTMKQFTQFFDKFISIEPTKESLWTDNNAQKVTQLAVKCLNQQGVKRNFFLWIHYMDPHGPYNPPPAYKKRWNRETLTKKFKKMPISKSKWIGLNGVPEYIAESMDIQSMDINEYIALYDGEIGFVDSQIGVLIEELEKRNMGKNTVIIITADHGESLGEHDFFGHEFLLYDNLLKIPLIIKYPEKFASNKIIERQVKIIDIMPTIFDILRIKKNGLLDGESFLPLIYEKNKTISPYAYSLYMNNDIEKYAVRTQEWKLIYNHNEEKYELYNLQKDPREITNLFSLANNGFIESLKQKLHNFIRETNSQKIEVDFFLDEETKRRLRMLGYLQ